MHQEVPGKDRKLPKRFVVAVLLGSMLEYYDLLVFAYFAVYIGHAFFPEADANSGLMRTLAVFAGGFIARPLGAFFLGRMADRHGRKPAMMLSFAMIGIAGLGMTLTPSYAQIGPAAVVLLAVFRLLQSFAIGGETGTVSAYLVEIAPTHRRGLYVALQGVTQALGSACAGGIGVVLAATLAHQAFADYGWRIAFFLGVLIVPVGLLVRRDLPESMLAHSHTTERNEQPAHSWRPFLPTIVIGFVALSCSTFIGYSQSYATTYVINTLHRAATVGFVLPVINSVCTVVFAPIGGWLSDRFGRKPIMIACSLALSVIVLPVFFSIVETQNVLVLYAGIALLTSLGSVATGPAFLYLSEALPPRIRAGGVGVVYALATTVFGGTTQFLLTWLIAFTGNPIAPAYSWAAAALIAGVAFAFAKETSPARRRGRDWSLTSRPRSRPTTSPR